MYKIIQSNYVQVIRTPAINKIIPVQNNLMGILRENDIIFCFEKTIKRFTHIQILTKFGIGYVWSESIL